MLGLERILNGRQHGGGVVALDHRRHDVGDMLVAKERRVRAGLPASGGVRIPQMGADAVRELGEAAKEAKGEGAVDVVALELARQAGNDAVKG